MAIPLFEQHLSFILKQPGRTVTVKQVADGYILAINREGEEQIELHKQRKGIRVFRTLDSVSSLLSQRQILTFNVELMKKQEVKKQEEEPQNYDEIPF